MDLILKGLIGASIAIGIALISRTKNFFMAGMIPLFPAFGTLAHLMVGWKRGEGDLEKTLIFSMYSLIPYFVYLLGTLIAIRMGQTVTVSVVIGVGLWFASAAPIVYFWK